MMQALAHDSSAPHSDSDRLSLLQSGPIPAGGLDPERFDWAEAWHPVAYLQDLDRRKPTKFTLLGSDLVLWWDARASHWQAFLDQCPHRRVPLSEGRISEDGLLECPYHGWAFAGDGSCDRIPQQPDGGSAEQSPRACATAFPTAERQGMLFVYPGQADNAARVEVPILNVLDEAPQDWVCIDTFRDLPYDALTLLENVLDSSHIPFTHHKSVGNRNTVSPVELDMRMADRQGFTSFWEQGPRRGTLGSQTTRFVAPGLMWHDITSRQFGRTLTVVYATPIRKGECRIFARFPFKFSSKLPQLVIGLTPRWFSHVGQNRVLEDDQVFLHHQERYLDRLGDSESFARACYLPTKADTCVNGLRTWVATYDADPFPGETLPPALPKDELFDRYHSHTEHCASCRSALSTMQRLRMGVAIALALLWTMSPIVAVLYGQSASLWLASMAAIALGLGAGWLLLRRFERRFYQGDPIPARNLPQNQ